MLTLNAPDYPAKLQHIADPPLQIFIEGTHVNELLCRPAITIVGSRRVSAYGKIVTATFAEGLARAGALIISGLAIGVDSIAHQAALDAGGLTLAVLPAGLDRVYPPSHRTLAGRIVAQGGALLTEYKANTTPYPSNFIARNRIASALSDAVLITEAAERSGTLSTARFALEQGKDVMAVPGNINSPTSVGTNNLIKAGAMPVTCLEDVLSVLGLQGGAAPQAPVSSDPHEQAILTLIYAGTTDGGALLATSKLPVTLFNQTLTMLEINGRIRPLGNNHWAVIG
jgi:DNA processing protein